MLKKTITYDDLDGNKLSEDFYFNLSPAELTELHLSTDGGLDVVLEKMVADEDGGQIILMVKKIISMAIGMRSENGKRFIKNDEVRDDFMQSDAYSVLFMELVTQANKASDFINGLMPKDLQEQIKKSQNVELPSDDGVTMGWIRDDRDPTEEELRNMSKDELALAFKRMGERKAASQ